MRRINCLLIFLFCLCFTSVASAKETYSLAIVTKPGSAQHIAAQKFAELVQERSGGEVEISIFHSGALGTETEILQQIQIGAVHMGIITLGPFDTFVPQVKVIAFPFMFSNYQQVDNALSGPVGQAILSDLEEAGFKGLTFSENGFRNLTNSKRPVDTAKDVLGLKIRVMESQFHRAIWDALGANPTPMGWPIYSELQQGTIDGQENPLWVIAEYKLHEVQKYLSLTAHVYSAHVDIANLAWFKSLPKEHQDLLQQAMNDAARFQKDYNRNKEAEYLTYLKKQGMVINENPETDSFRTRVASLKSLAIYNHPRTRELLEMLLAETR